MSASKPSKACDGCPFNSGASVQFNPPCNLTPDLIIGLANREINLIMYGTEVPGRCPVLLQEAARSPESRLPYIVPLLGLDATAIATNSLEEASRRGSRVRTGLNGNVIIVDPADSLKDVVERLMNGNK